MPIFLIITFITILVLLAVNSQLPITFTLDYDILANDGYAAIFVFGISILKIKIKLIKLDLEEKKLSIRFNKRVMTFGIMPNGDKDSIFNYLTIPILTIIDFIYFDISLELGYKKDAFLTMLAMQTARTAVQIFTSVLRSSQELLVEDEYLPHFGKDVLKIHFSGIISGSVANIIYSLFHAGRIKSKRERKSHKRLKELTHDNIR